MSNKRLQQIIYMLSSITNLAESDAKQVILSTNTGKAIQQNEPTVMYEQQTENLYSIKEEMGQNPKYVYLANEISVASIVDAYNKMQEYSQLSDRKNFKKIAKNPQLKEIEKITIKQRRKNNLKQKYQNFLNWGGVKNAD